MNKKIVILPAFNEGRFISSILEELISNTDADILVIDDGSTDDTYIKVKKRGVRCIRHPVNEGYGKSLNDGFRVAVNNGYLKAVTMDCDAQHEPRLVENFFDELSSADVVSGSRYLNDSPVITDAPKERMIINRIITKKINTFTGYNLTDAFCGFKSYRVECFKKLNLTISGYGLPLQIWLQSAKAGLKVKELPVALIYHTRAGFTGAIESPAVRLRYYNEIIKREMRVKGVRSSNATNMESRQMLYSKNIKNGEAAQYVSNTEDLANRCL